MSTKTDLAKEIINKISPDYAKKRSFLFGNTEISEVFIETVAEAELFGKPPGKYVTIEADFPRLPFGNFDEEVSAVSSRAPYHETVPKHPRKSRSNPLSSIY